MTPKRYHTTTFTGWKSYKSAGNNPIRKAKIVPKRLAATPGRSVRRLQELPKGNRDPVQQSIRSKTIALGLPGTTLVPAKKSATTGSVDDYLTMVPADARPALKKLRKIIKAAAPETTEVISYRIPIFKYQGQALVGFGATENHCSFYVMSSSMIPKLARMRASELKGYDVSRCHRPLHA